MELRLPLKVDMEQDWILKDILIYPGAVGLDAFGPDSEGQCRLELPNWAKPKWAVTRGRLAQLGDFGDGQCTFVITSRRIWDRPSADRTPGYRW